MRKKLILICTMLIAVLCFTGCGNKDIFDTNYTYSKAIITLSNDKTVEVDVKQWRDYEDGEQIQVISKDGTIYLTSSYNCTLIKQ